MSREILYRAKRVDNNEWVSGYYWSNNLGNHFIRVVIENGEYVIKDYEVIEETLGQYTGLQDSDSNKVFEGDIVKQTHSCCNNSEEIVVAEVVYGKNAQFLVRHKIKKGFNKDKIRNYSIWKNCEVIGNVYDNKELLGELNE